MDLPRVVQEFQIGGASTVGFRGVSEKSLPHVIVHTDGACSGNPGPGGWGAILKFGDVER